jgi:F0F1-type ATP synthase assembly protein I
MSQEDEKKAFDENQFDGIPSDLSFSGTATPKTSEASDDKSTEDAYGDDYQYVAVERVSKSMVALASGVGFVLIGIVLYFFLNKYGDTDTYMMVFLMLLFSALIAFFYLLDELTIRPTSMTNRGMHFISGMFLGALILLIIIILNSYDDWLYIIPFFALAILMNVSVALFLYALMWEE